MAGDARFRRISLFFNGRKLGFVTEGNVQVDSNDEQITGTEGVLGMTDGIATLSGSFTEVIPVTGVDSDSLNIVLQKKYVTMGFLIGDQLLQSKCRLTSINVQWDSKAGSLRGNINFQGDEPKLV